jgi:hypothetical protein
MYRIEYDRGAKCLNIHVAGFWQVGDVQPFSDALETASRQAHAICPAFSAVIHSADFPVQANEVADLLTGVMARCIGSAGGNVGILVASQLNKMQVERTLVHPRVKPFLTLAEAQTWAAAPVAKG